MSETTEWDGQRPLREVSQALARVDDPEEIERFLHQFFTSSEAVEMGKRWALVRLLDQGMSQRAIASELGLSLCKITRGSKELKRENSAFKRMIHR